MESPQYNIQYNTYVMSNLIYSLLTYIYIYLLLLLFDHSSTYMLRFSEVKAEPWKLRSLQEPHGRCSVAPGLASRSRRGIGRTGDTVDDINPALPIIRNMP